jgi:hypothetical protein
LIQAKSVALIYHKIEGEGSEESEIDEEKPQQA